MSTKEITNSEDIIDSRDIIARIEDLTSQRDDFQYWIDLDQEHGSDWKDSDVEKWTEWDNSDEGMELRNLEKIQNECENYGDWKYGVTLLRDSYMDEEWAENELKDLGYLNNDLLWFISHNIDWNGVLEDLRQDYSEIDFDGITYWIRE
jgi:hypothetical protein